MSNIDLYKYIKKLDNDTSKHIKIGSGLVEVGAVDYVVDYLDPFEGFLS